MQTPRTLAAAFLSAAIIMTSGLALADKGGKHHGGSSASGSAASTSSNPDAKHDEGMGGMNHAANSPGAAGASHTDIDHHFNNAGPDVFNKHENDSKNDLDADTQFRFHGAVSTMDEKNAKLELKMRDGSKRQFDMDTAVANDLKTRKDTSNLVFFSIDGKRITGCAKIGETDRAKVTGINNDSVIIQTKNGETRLLAMDDKSIKRLRLHAGSDVSVTTGGPQGGRIVAMDMLKKHWSDKFSAKHTDRDTRLARVDNDVDGTKHKHADNDVDSSKHKAKAKDRDSDKDVADVDANGGDKAKVGCGGGKGASGHGRAFANQMAKDAANDASGHNPPGLPHECVNPAGHVRGFCKSGGSDSACGSGSGVVAGADVDTSAHKAKSKDRDSDKDVADVDSNGSDKTKVGCAGAKGGAGHGRAFANQMAKDAANDASGHNPPGLPHECVNPAGHVRGFCKSGGSEAACGGSGSGSGSEVAAVHTSASPNTRTAAPGTATVNTPGTVATSPGSGTPVNGGTVIASAPAARTPGMGASGPSSGPGMAPLVRGMSVGPAPAGSAVAPVGGAPAGPVAMAGKRAGHPTRVMGAAVGPTSGQIRLVRPMANTPCVWRKTTVAAATYHRYRVVGTSYTASHHPMHRTACH